MHFVYQEKNCLRCGHDRRYHRALQWSLYDVCQKPGCECAQFDPPPWKQQQQNKNNNNNNREAVRTGE